MSEAIIEALQAMQSDLNQVEVLSQNIANQNTAGYRAIETVARPFDVNSPQATGQQLPLTALNTADGPLKRTNNELDIAVVNGGFLEVEGGRDGRTALVRGGTLAFDDDNRPTINGRVLVLATEDSRGSSSEIRISAQSGEKNLNTGNFFQAISLSETSTLKLVSPGVYEVDSNHVLTDSDRVTVLQGYLEQSNVNSSQVVVQMMELSKHIESVQRSLRAIDEMLDSGINELGR